MIYKANTSDSALCHLLRIHLWGEAPDRALLGGMSLDDWTLCYRQACIQGVRALVFDAVSSLPAEICPPDTIVARLKRETEELSELNRSRRKSLAGLCAECSKAGLEPVVLKGFGIASLYPRPDYRESGDVDLWFQGKAAEADKLLGKIGEAISVPDTMHSRFGYEGLRIENHHRLLRPGRPGNAGLEPVLNGIRDIEAGRTIELCDGITAEIPGPVFQLLHGARHIISHLTQKFTLRNVIDWMLLLKDCPEGRGEVMKALSHAGFAPAIAMVETLAEDCLGMDTESALFRRDERWSGRLFSHILHPVPERVYGEGILKYLSARRKHFNDRFWMYRLIYGMSYPGYVALTIKKKIQEIKNDRI